ncbi:hypothetical protein N0V90_001438 [Kalmusia sp. IMI 367209]|nr:hypothetical protein N0V90_001438 [Kalmusia sp. IMI 367209]
MAASMDLSQLTPEMLAQIPAGTSPNGEYNLINPPTVGYYVLVANSILMLGMLIFAGLRFYVAMKVRGRFAVDDWVTVAAIVGACYYYITVCLGKGWVESFATPRYLQTFKLTVPTSSFALVSDLYVLMLPLVAISHLQLSTNKKVGVAAMFSTGLVCCCASSVTLYFQHRIYLNQSDYTYYVVFVYLGYTIEMCVGISTACMPSLARLHKDRNTASSSSAYGSSRKNTNNSHNSRLSTIEGYPKRSPYLHMEEASERGASSHELGRMPSHADATESHSYLGSNTGIALSLPQSSQECKVSHGGSLTTRG